MDAPALGTTAAPRQIDGFIMGERVHSSAMTSRLLEFARNNHVDLVVIVPSSRRTAADEA